jgi:hypothetical protein
LKGVPLRFELKKGFLTNYCFFFDAIHLSIQEEFEAKLKKDEELFSADSVWQNQVMGGGWSAIRLQRYDGFCFSNVFHLDDITVSIFFSSF